MSSGDMAHDEEEAGLKDDDDACPPCAHATLLLPASLPRAHPPTPASSSVQPKAGEGRAALYATQHREACPAGEGGEAQGRWDQLAQDVTDTESGVGDMPI